MRLETRVVILSSYTQSRRREILEAAAFLESNGLKRMQWYYEVPIRDIGGLTAHQAVLKGLRKKVLDLLAVWSSKEHIH